MIKNNLLTPDSAKKNFVFQTIYQAIMLIIPLFVSPYLTRTLGSTSLGIYTYTYSIAYYFAILAMLGINKHGQRIIAERRSDHIELRKTFWSLYAIHTITSAISLLLYCFYVLVLCDTNQEIAGCQAIYVLSVFFDLTWLFYGLEKFKTIAIRNAVIKVLNTICIFSFVNTPEDIGIYTLIMVLSALLGFLVVIPQVINAIPPIRISKKDVLEHIKPLFTLFIAVAAITLYTVFDKTLIGIMISMDDVAFYEYGDKIITIPKTFMTIISTVLFSRACQYASKKDILSLNKNAENSMIISSAIGFASCFGLMAIGDDFAIIYYGQDFMITGYVIKLMAILIIIIGIGEVFRSQYLYPMKNDKLMVKIVIMNACINLLLSVILIPIFGIYGAIVGTIVAEFAGLIFATYFTSKYVNLKIFVKNIVPFAIAGLVMYFLVILIKSKLSVSLYSLFIEIIIGGVIYICGSFIFFIMTNKESRRFLANITKKG